MATASDRLAIQHQKDVATVAGGVASAVIQTAMGADPAAISFWFSSALDGMLTRIQAGYALNRRSAMGYLPQHGALNGVTVSPVPGSLDIASTRARLEITGPVAFKRAIAAGVDQQQALESMASQMSGVSDELVRNGDRDVIHATASHGASGVIGWRRRLSGRACGFCAMLASRGSVYLSERSASEVVGRGRSVETAIRPKRAKGIHPRGTQSLGASYHPHCRCWPEPLYAHEVEPPEVQRLQRQWRRVTAGKSGNDAMRTWRRHWEQRATPAARAREGIVTPRPTNRLDDYAERAMTQREYQTQVLEQKIATAKADSAANIKSWERAIEREGPNGDPATLAYYRRALEAARNRPAQLRKDLAELRRSKDPALERPHPTQKLRTGTPSVERAQSYARGRVSDDVHAADRPAITGELERQAALVPRSTMRLGDVRFGEVGEDISFGGDPLAAYSPFEDILYSRRWIESRAAVEEAVARSNASRHWTRYDGEHGSIGGTTAHEFGHHVDRMISRAPEQARVLTETVARELRLGMMPGKIIDYRAELDRLVEDNWVYIGERVSKYAAKNANEFLAEVWREYSSMGEAARPYIRRIGEVMRQLAEDNAFGRGVARAGEALAQEVVQLDLSALKLPELRALAKERGLTGYSKLTKPQLLERLGGEAKPITVVKPVGKPGDLSGLKVTELRALAKERGVAGYSKLTKPQLLDRLGGGKTGGLKFSAEDVAQRIGAATDARDIAAAIEGLTARQLGDVVVMFGGPDTAPNALAFRYLAVLKEERRLAIGIAGPPTEADVLLALERLSRPQLERVFRQLNMEHVLTERAPVKRFGDKRGPAFRTTATDEELRRAAIREYKGIRLRQIGAGGDRQAYAELVDTSLGIKPPAGLREVISMRKPVPPPEDALVVAARERQAAIDYARARATLLTEAEHWLDSQGSFETMGVQLRRDAKRLGIEGHKDVAALFRALDSGSEVKVRQAIDTIAGKQKLARIESAGDVVPFDRTKHAALGSGVRDGQYVVVVRPGYTFDRNGELIRLHKATVEAATKEEIAAARGAKVVPELSRANGIDLIEKSGPDKLAKAIDAKARVRATESRNPTDRRGPNGDEQLWQIREKQGFNGKPTVVTKAQLDQLITERGHIELYRGFQDYGGKDARYFADQLRSGSNFAGFGIYGNGTYVTDAYAKAANWGAGIGAREGGGVVVRMAIGQDVRMISYPSLERMHAAFLAEHGLDELTAGVWADPGRLAAALGFDVIVAPARGGIEYVILNRTVLFIEAA